MPPVFGAYGKRDLQNISLRERKFAYARFSLLKELVDALEKKTFAEIRIRDLCAAAEISEPSFFNYFPEKDDLLNYFVALWGIELELFSQKNSPGLSALEAAFAHTGKTAILYPQLMKELLAYQARANVPERLKVLKELTLAEKILAFGCAPDLAEIAPHGIRSWLMQNVQSAILRRELPSHTNLHTAAIAFGAVFFGVAGLAAAENFARLPQQYADTLQIIISGLRKGGKKK
ncbi:MAG: hypothetical protein LDLANPLL_01324 [Turneriella sp.]|nr:hypothetical protein [Turneriella sp.]